MCVLKQITFRYAVSETHVYFGDVVSGSPVFDCSSKTTVLSIELNTPFFLNSSRGFSLSGSAEMV